VRYSVAMPRALRYPERLDVKLSEGKTAALIDFAPEQPPSVTAREIIEQRLRDAAEAKLAKVLTQKPKRTPT
jgi:hypothetical protein